MTDSSPFAHGRSALTIVVSWSVALALLASAACRPAPPADRVRVSGQVEATEVQVASQVAGQMQKMVNAATSKLLYQFEVKGKLSDPQIKPVPAPLLTDAAASIFGRMLQEAKDADLLKSLEESKE